PQAANGTTNPALSAMLAITTGPAAPPAAHAAFMAATATAWPLGPASEPSATIAAVGVHSPVSTAPANTAVISSGASDSYTGSHGSSTAATRSRLTMGTTRPIRSLSGPRTTLKSAASR